MTNKMVEDCKREIRITYRQDVNEYRAHDTNTRLIRAWYDEGLVTDEERKELRKYNSTYMMELD